MCIERRGRLYDIRPGLCLDSYVRPIFLERMFDIATKKGLPFHIWFHGWDFGETSKSIQKGIKTVLLPILDCAKDKESAGELTFETMVSAARRFERVSTG